MNLFRSGEFISHTGLSLRDKIECDALTDEDIETLACKIARRYTFTEVYGVPRGGRRLVTALEKYRSRKGIILIVDDVLTTGTSMEEMRQLINRKDAQGVVIFARGKCPEWVSAIYSEWDE